MSKHSWFPKGNYQECLGCGMRDGAEWYGRKQPCSGNWTGKKYKPQAATLTEPIAVVVKAPPVPRAITPNLQKTKMDSIANALKERGDKSVSKVASELGIDQSTMYFYAKKLGVVARKQKPVAVDPFVGVTRNQILIKAGHIEPKYALKLMKEHLDVTKPAFEDVPLFVNATTHYLSKCDETHRSISSRYALSIRRSLNRVDPTVHVTGFDRVSRA